MDFSILLWYAPRHQPSGATEERSKRQVVQPRLRSPNGYQAYFSAAVISVK